jgi:hypothetical protein
VLAVHWVRVPCLPNPSARTSPARDGFEKFGLHESLIKARFIKRNALKMLVFARV